MTSSIAMTTPRANIAKFMNVSSLQLTQIISDSQRHVIGLINYVILCGAISIFGTATNIINMIVFYRQGLDTTINISFFSLAVSDLCSLLFQQVFNLFVNPSFIDLDLPISYLELQYLTAAFPRAMFARITCQITAFITTERCMCVLFPLHVKRIITPKITTSVIVAIYLFTLMSPLPLYCTSAYTWKTNPTSNRTRLHLVLTKDHKMAELVVYFSHAFFTFLGFFSVLIFTLILIHKLQQKNEWRQTAHIDQEKAKSMSKRDRATIAMVVVIASILVACYTPAVLSSIMGLVVPGFTFNGRFSNVRALCWSIATLCENVNSSVNLFLYYKMSSNYRHTFQKIFPVCFQATKTELPTTDP